MNPSAGSRVAVCGASGYIGSALLPALAAAGWRLRVLARDAARLPAGDWDVVIWDGAGPLPIGAFADCGAVINLAGAGIAERRWTAARKAELVRSRVDLSSYIAAAVIRDGVPTLIQASGIAGYGRSGAPADETAPLVNHGFLSWLSIAWEGALRPAQAHGVRVVFLRFGVVIAAGRAGPLAQMLPPWPLPLAPLGSGSQAMQWIHRDDAVGLVLAALGDAAWRGGVNAVAPESVDNRQFLRALARSRGRLWSPIAVPGMALRLALGELAEDLLLCGRPALPRRATERGYAWRYPTLAAALDACRP